MASTVPPAVSTSPSAKDDHTKPPDSAQSLNSAENVNRNTGAVPKMQRSTSSSACSRRLRNPLDETVASEKALSTVHNNVASTSSQESMHQASHSVLNSPAMPSYIRVASTGSTPLIQRPPCDELRSTEPPILSRSIAPTRGQYPQPPQQVLNRNTAAPLSDIVPVANEAPLPATAIYPGTSSIHTSGPKLKVASPPKQLFISRLAFTTSTDDVLEYIRSKVGLLSPLSCIKLTKDDNTDRVIASFKVTYPHEVDVLGNPSFWPEGVFIKPYKRPNSRVNFRATRLPRRAI